MNLLLRTRWLWCGFCFLLSGVAASAQFLIDRQVTIMPIQVRSTDGVTSVANPSQELYEAVADRIWAQAGIDIKFLPWVTYNNSTFLNVSTTPGPANNILTLSQLGGQPWSSVGATVVKMFFVQQIDGSASNLGYAVQSQLNQDIFSNPIVLQERTIAIANSAFSSGIIDVIAHEIGHVLGLNHTNLGAGGAANLMTDGGAKTAVTSINQITTDGLTGLDLLTGTIGGTNWGVDAGPFGPSAGLQIDRARIMTIAVPLALGDQYIYNAIPEPATTAAIAGALVLLLTGLYRRARAR